jgi:hypothetical protein
MGAEVGATTSLFPFDDSMSRYLDATGRSGVSELANKKSSLLVSEGQTWEDVGPFLGGDEGGTGQTPNSNDPYIYVDKFTDRLVKFDMHALAELNVEYSDDDGETWSTPFPTEGYGVPQGESTAISSIRSFGRIENLSKSVFTQFLH